MEKDIFIKLVLKTLLENETSFWDWLESENCYVTRKTVPRGMNSSMLEYFNDLLTN